MKKRQDHVIDLLHNFTESIIEDRRKSLLAEQVEEESKHELLKFYLFLCLFLSADLSLLYKIPYPYQSKSMMTLVPKRNWPYLTSSSSQQLMESH